MRLLVDSDNALGSPRGDVDDALAVAALLASGLPVAALASVGGNTPEPLAAANNRALGVLCGFPGPYLRGATAADGERVDEAAWLWAGEPLTVVALGPLTNLAAALAAARRGSRLDVAEVLVVGGSLTSRGRWPPLWPHEFNLTHDLPATRAVWDSPLPLTVVPLDVARRLRVGTRELRELAGELGEALRRGSRRWLRRMRLLRASRTFPAYDLLAAACLFAPEAVERAETAARLHARGWIEWGAGERRVTVVREVDAPAVWRRGAALLNAPRGAPGSPPPQAPPPRR
ncbi:MAG TPA: nucleoside hydrolase [Thermoanaerobaculia bacterium]|nr:nucleoside hydrolase [Thermoanaerobaculia bacterium]